ncbi:hypothetical protein ACG9VV_000869 [Vibrio alginolyticus]|uniref:hypothetical protein n=1 Tax=Vibrio alginolyticus TaxID=663 RepID=UPI0037483925
MMYQEMLGAFPCIDFGSLTISDVNDALDSVELQDIALGAEFSLRVKANDLLKELRLIQEKHYGQNLKLVSELIFGYLSIDLNTLSGKELNALYQNSQLRALTLYANNREAEMLFEFYERLGRMRLSASGELQAGVCE